MIDIQDKSECCGCGACAQKCPKKCITMQTDEEGFAYPLVDESLCINCGLCEKVCPVINQNEARRPLHTFAAFVEDEDIRLNSSSGGLFSHIALQVIEQGGVVFGARFNERWEVVHDYTETAEGIQMFMGSKYVQSVIGNAFLKVQEFLRQGRMVLFTGTPCQISGLHHFLQKKYENLLTVDIVCHGVPSPLVWREYLNSLKLDRISFINFRSKATGWKNYSLEIRGYDRFSAPFKLSEPFSSNAFSVGFMHNLYLRPSCFSCPSRKGKSGSLITLGDLWGIDQYEGIVDDDKGCSLILQYRDNFDLINELYKKTIDYERVIVSNPCIVRDTVLPKQRKQFYKYFHREGLIKAIKKYTKPSRYSTYVFKCKHIVYLALKATGLKR